mgnify:CR=1 FL=1
MRRTFTLAIAALAALLTFADAPLPKRTGATVLPQPSKIGVVAQQAKEAMAKKQLEAEKANAANQTSTSVFRRQSRCNMAAAKGMKMAANFTPTTELVVLPEGAVVEQWYFNAYDEGNSKSVHNAVMNVSFAGKDVYMQGLSKGAPTAWVKGSVAGSAITFASGQFMGKNEWDSNVWFIGADASEYIPAFIDNVEAFYDADMKEIIFRNPYLINGATDEVCYYEYYSGVKVTAAEIPITEPVITDLTATLPYLNTFDTVDEQNEAAIYDANEDNSTFTFHADGSGNGMARYTWSSYNSADDYLVFPGVELKAGEVYAISLDAKNSGYNERLEVVAGKAAKVSAFTIQVIEPTDITTLYEFVKCSNKSFTVEEDGTYFFAVHAISYPNMYFLDIDNFSIKNNNVPEPVKVADLAVAADPTGAKSATITFTVPNKTTAGKEITENLVVKVTRDGVEFFNEERAAGSAVEIVDNDVTMGSHQYAVTTTLNGIESESVSANVYVGEDIPGIVTNVLGYDRVDKVELFWQAPTEGAYGGIIVPDKLTYNVYPVEMIDFFGYLYPQVDTEHPIYTDLTECHALFEWNTSEGEQTITYFAISAKNEAGESSTEYAYVLTGEAYELPVHEEFYNYDNEYWWEKNCDDDNYYGGGGAWMGNIGDKFALVFTSVGEGWVNSTIGKININGAKNPCVTLDYVADKETQISVIIYDPEGNQVCNSFTAVTDEVTHVNFPIKDFNDAPWIRVEVRADFAEAGMFSFTNFNVIDLLQHDLAVALVAPEEVIAGKPAHLTAYVMNFTENVPEAESYTVNIYANNELIAEFKGTEIGFYETATFEKTYATTVFNLEPVTFKAVVEYALDENPEDNADELTTKILAPEVEPVDAVSAKKDGDNVLIEWEFAEGVYREVTEDFEDAVSLSESFGDWTFIDGDNAEIGGFGGIYLPFNTVAWFVIDSTDPTFLGNTTFAASSGTKYMSTMFNKGSVQNDDWMISPELPGIAQTISFKARTYGGWGKEILEFLYSTTDTNPESFTLIDTKEIEESGMNPDIVPWYDYSFEVPEGAKYFALRDVTKDVYACFVDDVTYSAVRKTPKAYVIYIDGEWAYTAKSNDRSFIYDKLLSEGTHTVSVVAVYDEFESLPVSTTVDVPSGINDATVDEVKDVYTIGGIRMNDTNDLKPGVYVRKGDKIMVK